MNVETILSIVTVAVLVYLIVSKKSCKCGKDESLCVNTRYGPVSSVPASSVVNANMALVHTTSLGQAPLGNPKYWKGPGTPLNQGQYGIRQKVYPLNKTTDYHAPKAQYPVYTDAGLPAQCTPIDIS